MAIMTVFPLDSLEIRSPSAPWCQQKFQWVPGKKASLSTSFYQLVILTMEILLMRSRQCPRAVFLEGQSERTQSPRNLGMV